MSSIRRWLAIVSMAAIALGCGGPSDDDVDGGASRDASATDARADRPDSPSRDGAPPSDADAPPAMTDVLRDVRDADGRDASSDRDARRDIDVDAVYPFDNASDAPPVLDAGTDVGDATAFPDGSDAMPPVDVSTDADADVTPDADDGCGLACILVSLSIVPPNASLSPHTTRQFAAIGTFADSSTRNMTTEVHWTASAPFIAQASNSSAARGLVTAMTTGQSTIGAELGNVATTTEVSVLTSDPVSLVIEPHAASLAQGTTVQLTAVAFFSDATTTQDWTTLATWTSSAPSVASVDANGLIVALVPGTSTITASLFQMTASTTLTVSPATLIDLTVAPAGATLPVGVVKLLVATGHFNDASTQNMTSQVTWGSSDATRAAVDNAAGAKGRLSALAPGLTTITAALGAVSGTAAVEVSTATLQGISISLASPHLVLGMVVPLQATGHYSDGTTADLTRIVSWSSLNGQVASVGGTTLHANREGTTTIAASYSGVNATSPIDVRAAALTSIALLPANPSIATGAAVSMQAIGHYADGATFDLTGLAVWKTTAPAIAAASNLEGARGTVTGLAPGTATIVVSYAGGGGSTTATVLP
jgi:hypothetical protein